MNEVKGDRRRDRADRAARHERRTAWAIAVQLQIPRSTVAAVLALGGARARQQTIFEKLEVNSMAEMARLAADLGIDPSKPPSCTNDQ